MKIFYCWLVSILMPYQFYAQYQSPVKHPIRLGGTFGELRGTHFHAGIDIKPSSQGYEGDTIYAIGDGFVSRVRTQRGGFGRAIYIDHPDGHRSVYAHLSKVLQPIYTSLLNEQKISESYEVDIELTPHQIKISKGQAIGILGNAGSSNGAHLHFEIRESATDITLNPFDFGIKPGDHINPSLNIVSIHGLTQDLYDLSYIPFSGFARTSSGVIPTLSVHAWRAGISINASDMQDGAPNKNGYYEAKLYVDDTLYYHFQMDRVSYDQGSLINCFIDYPLRKKQKRTEALLYSMPTNTALPVKYVNNRGLISLYSQVERRVKIIVSDYMGNQTFAFFNLKRSEDMQEINRSNPEAMVLNAVEDHVINTDLATVKFDNNSFARTQYVTIKKTLGPLRCVSIGDKNEAVIKPYQLCIPIESSILTTDKTVIISDFEDGKPNGYGGSKVGNLFCTKVPSFGNYCLTNDETPPTATILSNLKKLGTATHIIARLDDNISYKSPAKTFSYKVYIDDNFIPCEYKESAKRLTIPLAGLTKGSHVLRIELKDYVGNMAIFRQDFNL